MSNIPFYQIFSARRAFQFNHLAFSGVRGHHKLKHSLTADVLIADSISQNIHGSVSAEMKNRSNGAKARLSSVTFARELKALRYALQRCTPDSSATIYSHMFLWMNSALLGDCLRPLVPLRATSFTIAASGSACELFEYSTCLKCSYRRPGRNNPLWAYLHILAVDATTENAINTVVVSPTNLIRSNSVLVSLVWLIVVRERDYRVAVTYATVTNLLLQSQRMAWNSTIDPVELTLQGSLLSSVKLRQRRVLAQTSK